MSASFRLFLLSCVCGLGAAAPLSAQFVLEGGPRFGYYKPTGRFDPASSFHVGLPRTPADLAGLAWGGQVRLWVGERVGFQVQGDAAAGTVPMVVTPGGEAGPYATRVTDVGGQLLFTVLERPARYRLWIGGGAGRIRHGGEAYDTTRSGSTSSSAGLFGVGGNVRLLGHLRAAGGVTGLFYRYDLEMPAAYGGNGGTLQSGRRRDALATVGIEWSTK